MFWKVHYHNFTYQPSSVQRIAKYTLSEWIMWDTLALHFITECNTWERLLKITTHFIYNNVRNSSWTIMPREVFIHTHLWSQLSLCTITDSKVDLYVQFNPFLLSRNERGSYVNQNPTSRTTVIRRQRHPLRISLTWSLSNHILIYVECHFPLHHELIVLLAHNYTRDRSNDTLLYNSINRNTFSASE